MIDYLQTKYSLLINKNVILNLQSLAAHKGRCQKHPEGGCSLDRAERNNFYGIAHFRQILLYNTKLESFIKKLASYL